MSASGAVNPIRKFLRQVVDDPRTRDLPDAELLRRVQTGQAEEAFPTLLRRHGTMVLDVCRSVLGNGSDAEDAFQATFLVFAHKARSIRLGGITRELVPRRRPPDGVEGPDADRDPTAVRIPHASTRGRPAEGHELAGGAADRARGVGPVARPISRRGGRVLPGMDDAIEGCGPHGDRGADVTGPARLRAGDVAAATRPAGAGAGRRPAPRRRMADCGPCPRSGNDGSESGRSRRLHRIGAGADGRTLFFRCFRSHKGSFKTHGDDISQTRRLGRGVRGGVLLDRGDHGRGGHPRPGRDVRRSPNGARESPPRPNRRPWCRNRNPS